MFLKLFQLLFVIWVLAFLVTQILLPTLNRLPLFPVFRRRAKIEKEIIRVRGEQADKDLDQKLRQEKLKARRRNKA